MRPASTSAAVVKAKTKAKSKGGGGKKGLGNAKAAASRGDSKGEKDDHDDAKDRNGDDESGEPRKKKGKKAKPDPEVAQRLSQLEVQKDLLLCQQRWSTKIKLLNKEVTQSMTAAESFDETSGFLDLGMFLLSACVWIPILFKPKAKTTQREFPSV